LLSLPRQLLPTAGADPPVHTAHAEFPCHDAGIAAAVAEALAPELLEGPEGSTARLAQDGDVLRLHIEAHDASTLRAALQSAVRLLDAALRVASVGPGTTKVK